MATYNLKVKLDNGDPGVGAGVVLVDKTGTPVTDSNGNIIGAVADENGDVTLTGTGDSFKVTYVGFAPQTVPVSTATVTLVSSTQSFSDVTISGCGGKFKKLDTKTGKCVKDWKAFLQYYWWAIVAIALFIVALIIFLKTQKKA